MRVVAEYKTKAKWSLKIGESGYPFCGYTEGHWMQERIAKVLPAGVNLILLGSMMLSGVSRGRSSVSFHLKTACESFSGHTTASGAELLFGAVARGEMTLQEDTWNLLEHPHRAERELVTAPVFRGYWTFSKQGTEYALIPAPVHLTPRGA